MTTDLRTSILVNRQVPEFIREEYPLFITFLEAYYEYLETQQGVQLNDLIAKGKDLKTISDVDRSIDDFEVQFFNSFAPFLPKNVDIDKAFLIKNILPLYLAKGAENSFKLLFRFLFGDELELKYPKNNILRASDGKWSVESSLKISNDIHSVYTGDGTTKTFYLAPCRCPLTDNVLPFRGTVYINDVEQSSGYHVRQETKKLVFDTAPANGAQIKVLYLAIDEQIFVNRKITGQTSGATAIIEKVSQKYVNNVLINEAFLTNANIIGRFQTGEILATTYINPDDVLINLELTTVSSFLTIELIEGGANYNVGDPVIFNTTATVQPSAFVSSVFQGVIDRTTIADGGSGFVNNKRIAAIGYDPSALDFAISSIDTTGANTTNTFVVLSNIIDDIDPANTTINAADYALPANTITPQNSSTKIIHSLGTTAYSNIGEISGVAISNSTVGVITIPTLNAAPANLTISTSNVLIDTFGSLGKLVISDGGEDYEIFDELVFTNKPMSFGIGAEAEVRNVDATGAITEVSFVPSKISGTVDVTATNNVMVSGTNTFFEDELRVGDQIMVGYDTRTIDVIASNTSLNVTSASWTQTYTDRNIRLLNLNLLGGQGYTQNKLPTVTVTSSNGANAEIVVTGILGDGESIIPSSTRKPGQIERLTVTNAGRGITGLIEVDLTQTGDGTATANAAFTPTFEIFPGRWTTSDSILSSADRKLQGRDYYVNYAYLTSSTIQFDRYKTIFKSLLHPAGFKPYAELIRQDEIDQTGLESDSLTLASTIKVLSGTVNVNSTIYVIGTNTKFEVANTNGLLTIGSYIAVNSEIRVVNAIISNTELTVSSAFTNSANNQELVVVNTAYNAVSTEDSVEITTENNLIITVEP